MIWELLPRLAPVLEHDPDTQWYIAGRFTEVWRNLVDVTVARMEDDGAIHIKHSMIPPNVEHLLELCKVSSLETLLR